MDWTEAVERHCIGKKRATVIKYKRAGKDFSMYCYQAGVNWRLAKYHDCLGFLEYLRAKPGIMSPSGHDKYGNRTIRAALVIVKAIYTKNRLDGSIFDPALELVPFSHKPQKRKTEMVPFDQVMQLIDKCAKVRGLDYLSPVNFRNQAYLALGFGGGLRTSESCKLRMGDIRKTAKGTVYVHLHDTKTNVAAEQAIAPALVPYLLNYREIRLKDGALPGDPFLTSYDYSGQVPSGRYVNVRRMLSWFWAICENTLGRRLGTHSMRATAITKLISDGVPHRQIQDFSRHSTIQMVEQYDKLLISTDESVAQKLSYKTK